MRRRVMVIGAAYGSLGAAVLASAERAGYEAFAAGISGEQVPLDVVTDPIIAMTDMLLAIQPQYVVCTVGVNEARPDGDPGPWLAKHFEVNVIGPMRLYEAYLEARYNPAFMVSGNAHFAFVSSNSAHLPRSSSAAYCASKAALSMAVRVAARETGAGSSGPLTYAYEPGLLRGTPMTQRTRAEFAGPLTRMRGALDQGIDPYDLAELIVQNFDRGPAISGALIRYDADEL